MSALKRGSLCLRGEISINENKLLLHVYLFIPFFILMLLLYFCLFVDHVNKCIVLFLEILFIVLKSSVTMDVILS